MNIELIEINKLKPATYNPRQISTKQYKDLKQSIEKFGLVDPIKINGSISVILILISLLILLKLVSVTITLIL